MNRFLFFLALAFAPLFLAAQSPIGIWKTVDDNTGVAKSHVEIYEKGGKLFAKIIKTLENDADEVCDKCPGDKKGKPVVGLVFMENMKKDGAEWSGGSILDPENGKTYDCKIWLDANKPNVLKVRGYIAFFYRTQEWYRVAK